jgi:hypothetical protein
MGFDKWELFTKYGTVSLQQSELTIVSSWRIQHFVVCVINHLYNPSYLEFCENGADLQNDPTVYPLNLAISWSWFMLV